MYDALNSIGAPRKGESKHKKDDKFMRKAWLLCMVMAFLTLFNTIVSLKSLFL